jgi:hypothetical protein
MVDGSDKLKDGNFLTNQVRAVSAANSRHITKNNNSNTQT